MRMWNVDPGAMCRQHLLGEHLETHMFVGAIRQKKSMQGYVDAGMLETKALRKRHDALVKEMERRGYKHKSPLPIFECKPIGKVDPVASQRELKRRCPECAKRFKAIARR